MRRFLLILTLIFLPFSAFAQEKAADAVTVNKDNVKQLIETLESDTARQEFITNLKTLLKTEEGEAEEDGSVPLTETLGIDAQTRNLMDSYHSFLARNNLNDTRIGKLALTGGAFLIAALLVALIRGITERLHKHFNKLRQRYAIGHDRFRFYRLGIRYLGYVGVIGLLVYSLGIIWDIKSVSWLTGDQSIHFLGEIVGILFVVALAILVWEIISGSIDYGLKRANENNKMRMRTLLPLIKSVLFMAFAAMFGLVLLSELGINVIPLLAGAGIVGVAIGFGAQAMVKDFITGFTVIFEDLFHVGDVVNIAGISGVVEEITLRKVQLRDVNGAVHTVPFSEITTIMNQTKDFSYYLLDIAVSKNADIAAVEDAMSVVDASMRNDEAYADNILEPLEINGIDRFTDNAAIFRARVKTRPGQQWNVGREYNRRIQDMFNKRGIEMPFVQQVVWNRFPEGDPAKN